MPKLTINESKDLLRRRRLARKVGNDKEVNSIDKQINAAVRSGGWPNALTRAASASAEDRMSVGGPGSKWEEYSGRYIKPRQVDWEADT